MEILYNRFNTSRKAKYRLVTQIIKEGEILLVRKCASTEEAADHCQHMLESYKQLQRASKFLTLVEPKALDSRTITFPYVGDQELFDHKVTKAFLESDEAFVKLIKSYQGLITTLHNENPSYRFAFHQRFGEEFKGDKFMYPGCVDLNFGNLFVREGSDQWTLIDYEWVFPCAFPQTYILIRAIAEWYYGLTSNPRKRTLPELLALFGIKEEQLEEAYRVEYALQTLVNETVPPLDEYLQGMYAYLSRQLETPLTHPKLKEERLAEQVSTMSKKHQELTQFVTEYTWGTSEFPMYDVIIPVYNGYEFVKECVESVLAKTNYPKYRILIVDDASTDQQTIEYLDGIAEHPRVTLLRQSINGGFVRSVNAGMLASDHEVVLLNSDTIVTENWLLQMHQCRMSSTAVGSITPLTNNGTICSVPNWLEDNTLPKGVSADRMATLIHNISERSYPTLPTAVGFCMLIPRHVIMEVGVFDEDTFGKGYGEENDWCMRALAKGYQHYLDDATFIQHKGSMTFGKDSKKQALMEENLKKLAAKHPRYLSMVEKFIAADPLREILDNIILQLEFHNDKKSLLYLVHRDIRGAVGGTELHVADLCRQFQDQYNTMYCYVDRPQQRLVLCLYRNGEVVREMIFPLRYLATDTSIYNRSIDRALRIIIKATGVQFIHMHHLLDWPLSVGMLCKELGVPYAVTVHDYHFYCPCPQLLDQDKKFCEFSSDKKHCETCIPTNPYFRDPSTTFEELSVRRKNFAQLLEQAERVVTPSAYVQRALHRELQIPTDHIEVIPHAVDYCHLDTENRPDTKQLRVAFLGTFTVIKGSRLFTELVQSTDHPQVQFYMLGAIGDQEQFQQIRSKVKYLGAYQREQVSDLLHEHQIDVIVIPSIWPETFCYTLSEALVSGVKVITTTMGAQQERILEHTDSGWTFDVHLWAREARSLLHELWDLKAAGKSLRYGGGVDISLDAMMHAYELLYASLWHGRVPFRGTYVQEARSLLFSMRRSTGNSQGHAPQLNWKDYVYLFLVKVRLIHIARPLYYKLRSLRRSKSS